VKGKAFVLALEDWRSDRMDYNTRIRKRKRN